VGLRILCSKVLSAPEYDSYASDKFPIMLVLCSHLRKHCITFTNAQRALFSVSVTRFTLASFPDRRRNDLATFTSYGLHYLIRPVNTGLVHVILTIFPAVRTGLSC